MEAASLRSLIEAKLPGAVLEEQRFGRSTAPVVWVEAASVARVARQLSEAGLDWLECLSCFQVDSALVFTYFIGRSSDGETRPLSHVRVSVSLPAGREKVELPSVRSSWGAAGPFEDEIAELFGVRFAPRGGAMRLLPPEITGFPLRKGGSGASG